ncbi:hypothetical protein C8Q74DRAFT_1217009 [Fomes fomentarius]|nr:hypothetical protein C8Q74DRAFT_1217009 [Fomes fomentarius]
MSALIPTDDVSTLATLASAFWLFWFLCMFIAGKRISRWGVLAEANTHLAHMREHLRRGLGVIPVEEHQILYDRYCSLLDRREVVTNNRHVFTRLVPEVRKWLAQVCELREAVEVALEKYEVEFIGSALYGGTKLV